LHAEKAGLSRSAFSRWFLTREFPSSLDSEASISANGLTHPECRTVETNAGTAKARHFRPGASIRFRSFDYAQDVRPEARPIGFDWLCFLGPEIRAVFS